MTEYRIYYLSFPVICSFHTMYKEIDSSPHKPVWMGDLLMQDTESIQRPQTHFVLFFSVGPMSIYFNTI